MEQYDELFHRCRKRGTPLIEDGKAVFFWFGENPPHIIGDFNGWDVDDPVFLQQAEEGVWYFEIDLPNDAYIEYIFINEEGERIYDLLNHRRISNGMGKANQYFYMPGAKPTQWMVRRYGFDPASISHALLPAGNLLLGGKRNAHFYQPPSEDPVPLIVVWDGGDYLRRAKLAIIVDHMIFAGRIQPIALAMVENGGPARMVEYSCGEATLWFLLQYLLPEAGRRLNLVNPENDPGAYGVMGSSLGGLMAMYTGLRLPQIFGRVLAQSGAYQIEGFDFVTSTLVDHGPKLPLKIWMDAGKFEYLRDANRAMYDKLAARGYEVEYREYSAGHNYSAWRDDLPQGLEYLFG